MSGSVGEGPEIKGPEIKGPEVKGWCPGAYRPMASGDGLVVRVRPWLGEVTVTQSLALCDVAERFGTGALELTSRANLQIRGVSETEHQAVIDALSAVGLLDRDPALEGRRNLVMMPEWQPGDETHGLAVALLDVLPHLPDVPAKFGYAIDTGATPWLTDAPADIRLERETNGGLILVADGATSGRAVTPESAIGAVKEMLDWFVETGGRDAGRMARHLRATSLPTDWVQIPRREGRWPQSSAFGQLLGVPFGQIDTPALRTLIDASALETFRVLPGRRLLAMGASLARPDGFCAPNAPVLNVHACTGAPGCPQALGATRPLARQLAETMAPGETLHVSGCAKGCAHPRAADRTYVATQAGFDLVSGGAPWDAPDQRDLLPETILNNAAQGHDRTG